jgi:hypothetical protein
MECGKFGVVMNAVSIAIKRLKKPAKKIKQRDIMISRYDQKRDLDAFHELRRLMKLVAGGSHGQVARNHHGFGLDLINVSFESFQPIVLKSRSEMDVGAVKDLNHG